LLYNSGVDSMTTFAILLGALLTRVGLSMHAVGSVRARNAASMMARHLLDLSIAVLAYWAIGAAIAGQTQTPVIGLRVQSLLGREGLGLGVVSACIVGAMVMGATAERGRLWPLLAVSLLTAGVTLPIAINWDRLGWLHNLHFGGMWALPHVVGGTAASVAALMVGPRDNKYNHDGSTNIIPGHSLPFVQLGAMLTLAGGVLLMGVSNYMEPGGVNVLLAATAAVAAAAIYCQLAFAKIDLPLIAAAMIAGVVSVSGGAGGMAGWGAVLTGAIAGVLVCWSLVKLDLVVKLDDVTGSIAIHGVAGGWAILAATPVSEMFWGERLKALGVQALGLVAIVALTALITAVTLKLAGEWSPLHAKDADEFDGLDIAEHETAAYPDFQQNSIR
jgi:Amt family ammonium transporter